MLKRKATTNERLRSIAKKRRVVRPKASLSAVLRSRAYEIKTVDIPATTTTISTTGTFNLLNGIQEGSSFFNRIGRKVTMKSLRFIGNIKAGTAGALDEYSRIMILYDRQPNAAFPVTSDVLASVDNTGSSTSTSYDHLNMNNAERFLVLADIRIDAPNLQSAAQQSPSVGSVIDYTKNEVNIDRFIKLTNLETHYKSSSNPAVVSDINTGSLILFTLGKNASATQNLTLTWSSRLRYMDK